MIQAFYWLLSAALKAVGWNRVQMQQSEPPHLEHD